MSKHYRVLSAVLLAFHLVLAKPCFAMYKVPATPLNDAQSQESEASESSNQEKTHQCAKCKKPADKRCGQCRSTYYCSENCQKEDWGTHRSKCEEPVLDMQVEEVESSKSVVLPAKLVRYLLIKTKRHYDRPVSVLPKRPESFVSNLVERVKINHRELTSSEKQALIKILDKWNVQKPQETAKDIRPTLDSYANGSTFGMITKVHQEFYDFAKDSFQKDLPILDIGAAYGIQTHRLLDLGAKVIATDIDPGHLAILVREARSENLDRLFVHLGRFPKDLDFKQDSIKGVMISQVLHFLPPEEFMDGLSRVFQWLTPQGKLTVFCMTPFNLTYSDQLVDIIEEKIKASDQLGKMGSLTEKDRSLSFPTYLGYIYNPNDPKRPVMHSQTRTTISRYLTLSGFRIEKVNHFISGTQMDALENFYDYAKMKKIPLLKAASMGIPLFVATYQRIAKIFPAELIPKRRESKDSHWPISEEDFPWGGFLFAVAVK